ncbi:MAG: four helix bundle protein [Candidatus Aminicenantaceae bacterium]
MNKEEVIDSIVEKAEEIEKEIYELTGKVFCGTSGIGILKSGLRKTAVSIAQNIAQAVLEFPNKKCLMYIQKSLSLLKTLNYYNFISRKIGYFTSSQYFRLKKKIKDITERTSLALKNFRV